METFKLYLEAMSEAAKRTRTLLYIIIVAALVVGLGIRRSASIITGSDVREIDALTALDVEAKETAFEHHRGPKPLASEQAYLHGYRQKFPYATLEERIDDIEEEREKNRGIVIPILGLQFDETDLPLFSGLTFTVLLGLLCYSIAKEKKVYALSREAATREFSEEKLGEGLELLRLTQLTRFSYKGPKAGLLSISVHPMYLLIIPPVVHLLVVAGYINMMRTALLLPRTRVTEELARLMNANDQIILLAAIFSGIAIVVLAITCAYLSKVVTTEMQKDIPSPVAPDLTADSKVMESGSVIPAHQEG
ncbi:MAG TPA: hypothetical protein VGL56_19885 [Fimbriimonadaceae bacterium]|jgi:hypothetical protein